VVGFDLDSDRVHPAPGPARPAGEQGLLLVSGPSVFPGYLGQDAPNPFTERDGKRWYVTGDLVKMDGDGYIHFAGRLKRFIKVGGEMISLPELEAPLARRWPPRDTDGGMQAPQVAVEGVEQDNEHEHRIVLFATLPVSLAEANDLLEQAGLRGVKRLTEVRQVKSIPVLGTKGSPDYKVLRAQLTA
jgi:long-chain-fatty-acid--[acyl-carrier-protein] ligase